MGPRLNTSGRSIFIAAILTLSFQNCTSSSTGGLFEDTNDTSSVAPNGLSLNSASPLILTEGSPLQVTVYANAAQADRIITISASGQSLAANPAADFSQLPSSVTLPAGQSQVTVTLSAASDSSSEGDETFTITLTLEGQSINGTLIIRDALVAPPTDCPAQSFYCDYDTGTCSLSAPAATRGSLEPLIKTFPAAIHTQVVSVDCADNNKYRYVGTFSGTAAYQCLNGALTGPIVNCTFTAYVEPYDPGE